MRDIDVAEILWRVPDDEPSTAWTTHWWVHGLTLTERVAEHTPSLLLEKRASVLIYHKVSRWRAGFPDSAFDARLAEAGINVPILERLLGESPDALARRVAKPVWASFVERAVGLVRSQLAASTSYTWEEGFGAIVNPFAEAAADDLVTVEPGLRGLRAVFVEQTRAHLVALARRTLVLELNVFRVSGRLDGATPELRFASFIHQLLTRPGLLTLLNEYVVLARLLAQACCQNVAAWSEMYGRFVIDRPDVVAHIFGCDDPGALVDIVAGLGDRHQGGRTVALFRFANGARVIYKPRSLTASALFNEAVSWLNVQLPRLGLNAPAVLARSGYGWMEFVAHEPCREMVDIDRFYHRQGALLALLHALDATDIHFENVVARGAEPMLVDTETLFHPRLRFVGPREADPAAEAFQSSVSSTALLCLPMVGDHGVLDLSGLGADKGVRSPIDVVAWESPGTDEMRLCRQRPTLAGAANRPRIDGRDANPEDFATSILSGFRDAYQSIVSERSDLVGPDGLLAREEVINARVVARPSRVYAALLDESTHPNVLRDALDRERMFDTLWADSWNTGLWWRLVSHEIEQLWTGDIPFFHSPSDSTDLCATSGTIAGALDAPALVRVGNKVAALGAVDQYHQEWIIRAAIACRTPVGSHKPGGPLPVGTAATLPDTDRILAAARGIADQIMAMAFDNGDRANWLCLEPIDDRQWMVLPQGAGLATGYCGTAVFLAQLAHVTGEARPAVVARHAVHHIPDLFAQLEQHPEMVTAAGAGGFAGLGGIAYTLSQLALLLGDSEIRDWAQVAVRLAARAIDSHDVSVLTGAAGCLAAMVAVHDGSGIPLAWDTARSLADCVLGADIAAHPPGFGVGTAGIGWALARFGTAGGGTAYTDAGRALLRGSYPSPDDLRWCHGLPGVALAVMDQDDPTRTTVVDRAVAAVAAAGPCDDHSLCHGELGRLELLTIADAGGDRRASAALIPRVGMALSALERWGPQCATPGRVASPCLLNGLAGIGYGLLRLALPTQTPSLLLLQTLSTNSSASSGLPAGEK